MQIKFKKNLVGPCAQPQVLNHAQGTTMNACSWAPNLLGFRLAGSFGRPPLSSLPSIDTSPASPLGQGEARKKGIGDWIYGFVGGGVRWMCRVGTGAGVEGFAAGAVPRGAATAAEPRLQRPGPAQAQGTHHDGGLASFLLHGAPDRRVRYVYYSPPLIKNLRVTEASIDD